MSIWQILEQILHWELEAQPGPVEVAWAGQQEAAWVGQREVEWVRGELRCREQRSAARRDRWAAGLVSLPEGPCGLVAMMVAFPKML